MINTNIVIPDKFEDRFLTYLAIMDHLHEVISIDSEWKNYKNTTLDEPVRKSIKEDVIKGHFNSELIDLYILINSYFANDELLQTRIEKFWAKNKKQ
jgi:hypothetical protein